jgi:radical SAM protein with 4Fe4S-binding SPASM domain
MYKIDKDRRMDSTKLLWHMPQVVDRFTHGKRVAPIHIDMGIAKFCNIACCFCYGKYQNISKKMIERNALLTTMRDACDIGVKSIGFIGDGEPTCNPALYDALRIGKAGGLDLAVSTSGVALNTDEKIDAVLSSCTWMRFCLSAGTREGYKTIHGKDYFELVLENVRKVVEYKRKHGLTCDVGLQAVFVPTIMIDEMVEESRLAAELGVDYLVIKQCSLPDDGSSGMAHFDINYYDKPEVDEALKKCESYSNEVTKIIPKWNLIKQKGRKNYSYCHSISLISEMSGNGDWYPCGFMFGEKPEFEKYRFGNVHEKSLKEIWESDHYWKIVEHMENEFDVQKECKGCCRQDKCNEFLSDFRNPPRGVNFI